MPDLFVDGESASRAKWIAALEESAALGKSVLEDLSQARRDTLLRFENNLIALNGRRQQAARVLGKDTAGRFLVTDFLALDPVQTSASVRADVGAATLRERVDSTEATVKNARFDSSVSSYEPFGDYYRVIAPGGTPPVGTFLIELTEASQLNLVVLDLLATPGRPEITVEGSNDGIKFTAAQSVGVHGYRAVAWMPAQTSVRFLRIRMTPNQPDTIGGSAYTFGISSLTMLKTEFFLRSQLVTQPLTINVQSPRLRFTADAEGDLEYYLSFNGGQAFGVTPGQILDVPGAVSWVGIAQVWGNGLLSWSRSQSWPLSDANFDDLSLLPADLYGNTLRLVPTGATTPALVARLDPASLQSTTAVSGGITSYGRMSKPYICWWDRQLFYRPYSPSLPGGYGDLSYTISYQTGPASLTAQLYVRFRTSDSSLTPVFRGAALENVYEVS